MPFLELILMACMLAAPPAQPSGGFIAFPSDWYTRVTDAKLPLAQKGLCFEEAWRQEFANLKAMKFDQVVVQYSVYDRSLYFDGKVRLGNEDLTPNLGDIIYRSLGAVVEQARAQQMRVWVGLRHRADWSQSKNWPKIVANSDRVIDETVAVAQALVDSKQLDPTSPWFAGWYICPEIDNFRPPDASVTAKSANAMLATLKAKLKKVADKPVAISGYFRVAEYNMKEREFNTYLRTMLAGPVVDLFILQDSVGVEDSLQHPADHIDKTQMTVLKNRFGLIKKTMVDLNIDVWGNIETLVASGQRSALPCRVRDQITAAGVFDKMIVFDTNVHMSAFGTRPGSVDLFEALYQKLAAKVYQPLPIPVGDAPGFPPFERTAPHRRTWLQEPGRATSARTRSTSMKGSIPMVLKQTLP